MSSVEAEDVEQEAPVPHEERAVVERRCQRTRPHEGHEWARTRNTPVLGLVRVTYDCPGIRGWEW